MATADQSDFLRTLYSRNHNRRAAEYQTVQSAPEIYPGSPTAGNKRYLKWRFPAFPQEPLPDAPDRAATGCSRWLDAADPSPLGDHISPWWKCRGGRYSAGVMPQVGWVYVPGLGFVRLLCQTHTASRVHYARGVTLGNRQLV